MDVLLVILILSLVCFRPSPAKLVLGIEILILLQTTTRKDLAGLNILFKNNKNWEPHYCTANCALLIVLFVACANLLKVPLIEQPLIYIV